jgi:hypothetical protein
MILNTGGKIYINDDHMQNTRYQTIVLITYRSSIEDTYQRDSILRIMIKSGSRLEYTAYQIVVHCCNSLDSFIRIPDPLIANVESSAVVHELHQLLCVGNVTC